MKEYYCPICDIYFYPAYTYDNPVCLADRVADCPKCNGKCWEKKTEEV